MEWTEQEAGKYLAESTFGSRKLFLLGDSICGFDPIQSITQPVLDAYAERTIDLERKRREYVKNCRRSQKAARRLNQFA